MADRDRAAAPRARSARSRRAGGGSPRGRVVVEEHVARGVRHARRGALRRPPPTARWCGESRNSSPRGAARAMTSAIGPRSAVSSEPMWLLMPTKPRKLSSWAAQPRDELARRQRAEQRVGPGPLVADRLHRHVQHQLVAGRPRRPRLLLERPGIGQERQRQRRLERFSRAGAAPVRAEVVDHHRDRRPPVDHRAATALRSQVGVRPACVRARARGDSVRPRSAWRSRAGAADAVAPRAPGAAPRPRRGEARRSAARIGAGSPSGTADRRHGPWRSAPAAALAIRPALRRPGHLELAAWRTPPGSPRSPASAVRTASSRPREALLGHLQAALPQRRAIDAARRAAPATAARADAQASRPSAPAPLEAMLDQRAAQPSRASSAAGGYGVDVVAMRKALPLQRPAGPATGRMVHHSRQLHALHQPD